MERQHCVGRNDWSQGGVYPDGGQGRDRGGGDEGNGAKDNCPSGKTRNEKIWRVKSWTYQKIKEKEKVQNSDKKEKLKFKSISNKLRNS